jgi:hypothetical protein
VLHANAHELEGFIRPRDIVFLHDPQTAGLAPTLIRCRRQCGSARPRWPRHLERRG